MATDTDLDTCMQLIAYARILVRNARHDGSLDLLKRALEIYQSAFALAESAQDVSMMELIREQVLTMIAVSEGLGDLYQ